MLHVESTRLEFGLCPKCGEDNPYIRWTTTDAFDRSFAEAEVVRHSGDHFHVRCSRCDYLWTASLDGKRREIRDAR